MKIFSKIKTTRTPVEGKKSVQMGEYHYTQSEIFTADDVKEVVDFLKTKCTIALSGGICFGKDLSQSVGYDNNKVNKLMFVASRLTDKTGKGIFTFSQISGMWKIQRVGDIDTVVGGDAVIEPVAPTAPAATDEKPVFDTAAAEAITNALSVCSTKKMVEDVKKANMQFAGTKEFDEMISKAWTNPPAK